MKHDELAEDLALAKGGIPFLNVSLGTIWNNKKSDPPRADLLVCRPSYKRFCISIYEVKISRSDFLKDLRSEKWRRYLPHCDRFYFACKKGILDLAEIPPEAGLVLRGPKGWYSRKAGPDLGTDIPLNTLKALIFAKQKRSAREKRMDDIGGMLSDFSYVRRDFGGRLKAARVLGRELGKLHEAAMECGGLPEAAEVLRKHSQSIQRHL